jgi:hypothetical protein
MAAVAEALDKIRSSELRRDALSGDGAVHTVLIEIEVPSPPQVMGSDRPSLTPGRPSWRIVGGAESESQVRATREAIEHALGRAAERYLPSAHAFVVKATGRELRKITDIPCVLAIWPNTRRERGSG